jgi:hypothetical protein
MRALRQRLSGVIGLWLVCQFAGLASGPLSVAGTIASAAVQKCTCPPGTAPGGACPMHHTREGARECVLKSASSSSDTALLSLVGTLGLMPAAQTIDALLPLAAQSVLPVSPFPTTRSDRPESPPPRG